MTKTTDRKAAVSVELFESPDGVLNVIIRADQQPKAEGLEALRRRPRRAPKRAH